MALTGPDGTFKRKQTHASWNYWPSTQNYWANGYGPHGFWVPRRYQVKVTVRWENTNRSSWYADATSCTARVGTFG